MDIASIPTDNVYVKGLPLDIDEGTLREKFGAFGKIVSCRVIATTALIRFETVEEAEVAVREANGKMVVNRTGGGCRCRCRSTRSSRLRPVCRRIRIYTYGIFQEIWTKRR